ncbi:peptidase S41 [bacterium]|nr:peptidase S41 [bacterium]
MKKILVSTLLLCSFGAFMPMYAKPAKEVPAEPREQEAKWLLYPAISPDGKQIAFSYMGDIYLMPTEGGQAFRLTSHPAYDTRPVWSPDGQKIAFASDRDGGLNIYVTGVQGGDPARLTTHSGDEIPLAFTSRNTVLYQAAGMPTVASRYFPDHTYPQVYEVDLEGHRPALFQASPMAAISLNARGDILYQDIKGYEDIWRKHHTSSVTRDIYLLKDGHHTRLTAYKGEDLNPVWAPDNLHFYYLSEQDGTFNVYRQKVGEGSGAERITRFHTYPVRFLSVARTGTLCFTYNGEIYTLEERGEPKKIAVEIHSDNAIDRIVKTVRRSGATEVSVSPKQKEVAFVLGGDVYVTSVDYATTIRLTNTPQTERSVDFAPDGRAVVYASERDSVWQIYQTSLQDKDEEMFTYATSLKEERLTHDPSPCFYPQYSPDGKEVAFLRNRTEICVLNLKSGKVRTAMDGKYEYSYSDGDQSFEWSPDSKWILAGYIGTGGWLHEDLALVKADGSGEIHNLTNSGYTENNGKFVLDGKAMIFMSDRSGYRSHGSWGAEEDVYMMFFDKTAFENFLMDKEERELAKKAEDKDKKDNKDGKKDSARSEKVEDLVFDFDHLEDRTLRLTYVSDNLGDMVMDKKGEKLYYIAPYNGKRSLWVKDLVEGKTEMKISDIGRAGGMDLDAGGENAYMVVSGGIKKVNLEGGQSTGVDFEAWHEDRPFEQREYLLRHIYRQVKDKFYDTTLRGLDWEGLYDNYRAFLPHVGNGYDFSILASELLGELNASHTGCRFYGGKRAAMPTASLGFFEDPAYKGDGIRIAEILHNSPLELCGKDLQAGDLITRIDGVDVLAGRDYYPLLEGKTGKSVRLTIRPKKGKEFEIKVKPVSESKTETLLYQRWIKRNEALVDSLSGGRLAYVHIEGMNSPSYRWVYRQLLNDKNRNREAVIIDTRHNGGGWLHDDIAVLFAGRKYSQLEPRGRFVSDEPHSQWNKPSCMLVCENNYSDAHGTPWVYQQLGLGKIIGTPVPGTMTAVWWESVPGGYVFGIPQVGVVPQIRKEQNQDGYIENYPLQPDVEVYNTPETLLQGRDLQIEKAVEVMLRDLDAAR